MKVFNGDFAEPLKKIISERTPIIYVITQKSILNVSQIEAGNVFQNKKLFTDGWQQSVFLDAYFNIFENKLQNIERNNLTHKSMKLKDFITISQQT